MKDKQHKRKKVPKDK